METLENMDIKYELEWKELWKSISKYLVLVLWFVMLFSIAGMYVATGFNYAKTFEHVSPRMFALGMLAIPIVIPIAMLILMILLMPFIKMSTIAIRNGCLYGRDKFMRKREIPLLEIQEITSFSDGGITTYTFHGKDDKQVQIVNVGGMKEVLEVLLLFCKQNSIGSNTKEKTS